MFVYPLIGRIMRATILKLKTILFTLLSSCQSAQNLSTSYLPSRLRLLFQLPLHCERSFTQPFCKPLQILRRRSDTHGAWHCSLFPSESWHAGLPVDLISSFHEKHFGGLSGCSHRWVSRWISSLATLSSSLQTKRPHSAATSLP